MKRQFVCVSAEVITIFYNLIEKSLAIVTNLGEAEGFLVVFIHVLFRRERSGTAFECNVKYCSRSVKSFHPASIISDFFQNFESYMHTRFIWPRYERICFEAFVLRNKKRVLLAEFTEIERNVISKCSKILFQIVLFLRRTMLH